jgi:WD40 repeat protein
MRVWDLLKPNAAPVAIEHPAIVSAVAFSPDGLRLASACDDGSVRVWNPADLKARPALLRGHDDRVWSIALSRGKLATASDDMSVRVYELEPSRVAPTVLRADQGKVQAVAFGPDGQILASGGDDNIVRVWKVDQGDALPALLRGHQQAVISVAIGADGRTLASADYDGVVRIWDLKHQDMPPFVLPDPGGVTVAFSPDGKKLASAGNKEVRLRDIQELNASPSILSGHENWVSSVAFSRDSHILASASLDNTIRLWDMQHPAAEATLLRGHENQVWSVAFSPDSQWIASGSHDKTVRIWNLAKPDKLPITLRGHEGKVRAVAVSSDSNTIASGGADKTIRLWDPHQPGEDPAMLTGHASEVTSLSFSPDGRRLASGSEDGTVRIWIANSVALADMVCEMVRRNLTGEEWDRFVGADIPYQRTCPNLPSGVISAPLKQGVDERPATPALLFPGDHAVFDHFPRTMTLRWAASPGAATYTVEVQFQGTIWVLVPHISATSYTLEFVGAQPGKWRVWSVGTTGEESAKSNWRDFRFTR